MLLSVVIPLGKESVHRDDELCFALRSLEAFLPHKNIVIVGDVPDWIQNVIHIPYKDTPGRKQLSIRSKILAACADNRVTDNFVFTNDDVFLLQPIKEVKSWCSGTLDKVREKGARPLEADLKAKGLGKIHFDVHAPIIYNKKKFIAAHKAGFHEDCIIKSLYGNFHKLKGEEMNDLKINLMMREENIRSLLLDDGTVKEGKKRARLFFSVGDYGMTREMYSVLNWLYPNKSKYEK